MKLALISDATEAEEINIKISYFSFGVQIANQKGDFFYWFSQFLEPGFNKSRIILLEAVSDSEHPKEPTPVSSKFPLICTN